MAKIKKKPATENVAGLSETLRLLNGIILGVLLSSLWKISGHYPGFVLPCVRNIFHL
jgi:hypothetical protein